MLTTYLKNIPYTKFILLEDNLRYKGIDILNFLITNHLKFTKDIKIQYCQFEYNKNIDKLNQSVTKTDFIGDASNWDSTDDTKLLSFTSNPCILVIDSLAHMIFRFGTTRTYQLLHKLKQNRNIIQIITVLHTDIIEDINDTNIFEHLSTLRMTLEGKFRSQKRISFLYKKPGGKMISDIEEYSFENDTLVTKPVAKLDAKTLIAENMSTVDPLSLTTFKIELDEKDKEGRDKLVLPYLPKDEQQGGQIFYEFDEIDDWDEEDPDDDLDF